MAGPLLETKLHVPRRRGGRVVRSRLNDRLARVTQTALTLVSAPAGFGKTTLVAEWIADAAPESRSAAWLSLDQRDDDPALFWAYLIAALRTAEPSLGSIALSLLDAPGTPIEDVLAALLNDLDDIGRELVLVLDDYHVIGSREIQDGMAFLLEHLPARLHLVIAGRADPALPLARLRARGELVEIRGADLRFTSDEAADYLNDAMGLTLTSQNVEALEARTEGWIAALQLAALSLQGRADVGGFIAGFAGDDRYIVDYLVEEVLQRQPDHIQRFLLQTSILGRLSGPLCDAVTGQTGGQAMLVGLERGNMFLVALDDRRRWFRYHHLFADVLQAHLIDEQSAELADLHRRAAEWLHHDGQTAEAIRHALAGRDFSRAADLVESAIPMLRRERRDATLRSWLEALPDEVIRLRPVLCVACAGSLMVRGETEGVEEWLLAAERWLNPPTLRDSSDKAAATMVVVDRELFGGLPSAVFLYRAARSLILGDLDGTMAHARRALDVVRADDHVGRGAPSAILGLAYWTRGDLATAYSWYAESLASFDRAGHLSDVMGCAIAAADIRSAQGRLRDATAIYEQLVRRSTEQPAVPRGAADMHVGLSQMLCERDDLQGALDHLRVSDELGEPAALPQNRYRYRVSMARVRAAQGDLQEAIRLLDEAERLYAGDFSPDTRPVPALRAAIWARQGAVGDALGWVRQRNLSVDDELTYVREFEHITLVRVLLVRYAEERAEESLRDAIRLLARLLEAAERQDRRGSILQICIVQALARQAGADTAAALGAIRRALALAEEDGYVRIFLDEGAPMIALLKAALQQRISTSYVRRLLAGTGRIEAGPPADDLLIEPLSERELDVLRLLGSDLDGPEIARRLSVSVNTVRTHTSHIYTKLGVNNRRAAVRRAGELELLTRRT